uniref:Trafficking protein particle complex subunit n=1 Tax=Chrysotila carterae TaxID=13221 RepID=A0A7S4FA88_CHRCT
MILLGTSSHLRIKLVRLMMCAACSAVVSQREDTSHLNQFIIHAALDMVDDLVWGTQNMYLKCVDKFNDYFISAFVTAGHIKLMLLHDVRNDDGIRNFFQEVYELYVRVLMNPFYEPSAQITSTFDARVKLLGRKYF